MTADPEWTGWLKVGKNDSHLIIASDGVFEKMTTQEVCGVVSATKSGIDVSAALGLVSPARERPIALLPSGQRAKKKSTSKRNSTIEVSYSASVFSLAIKISIL